VAAAGCFFGIAHAEEPLPRLRLIVETDAGGDPDDEQSLVRFLLYGNEWDVEGIIANRATARAGENLNSERTGLGIVRRQLAAYRECWPNLVRHDARYPSPDPLEQRTVPGFNESAEGEALIIAAVDREDPRPLWYSDWGTDDGAAKNNLQRALDRVLRERGPEGYARFKRVCGWLRQPPLASTKCASPRRFRCGSIRFVPSWTASAGITVFRA
jgi:hypothetical protein